VAQLALERRWTDWFARQDIDHIAFGVLVLRRPDTKRSGKFTSFIADKLPETGGGRQVESILHAMNTPLSPDSVPVLVPHVIYQQLVHDGDSYTSMPAELFALESAGIGLTVLPEALATILAVDGTSSASSLSGQQNPENTILQDAFQRGLIDLTANPSQDVSYT
jgi:hypothetical protein